MHHPQRILVVEDDSTMRASCRQALEDAGYEVLDAASPLEAETTLVREELDLVVTDLRMPNGGGEKVLSDARDVSPDLPVILITAYPTVRSAVEAFKSGVIDYVLKPFTTEQFITAVERALRMGRARDRAELLRRMSTPDSELSNMIGGSEPFHAMLTEIRRVAPLTGHVLIWGETGSGKELVAKAIHRFSRRSAGSFVVVNCAAIPDALVEAELFGYEKGAFTGAGAAKPGLLEEANQGTLFLDEVGDLALLAQAKLLRCLEDKTTRRVGGLDTRPVDIRVVAATNKDLRAEVQLQRFREDMFYRLSTLELRVPPLRERHHDIPALANHFLDRLRAEEQGFPFLGFSEDALERLAEHAWPGNVRELQNAVQKVCARARGPVITSEDLEEACLFETAGQERPSARGAAVADFERQYLAKALLQHGGNITHAAQALGIHRTTLQRLLKKRGVSLAEH